MHSYTFLALAAFVVFARATTVSLSRRQAECPAAYTGYTCDGQDIIYCKDGQVDNGVSGTACDLGYVCSANGNEYACSFPLP
ncbi:hypothetical protein BKA93DRAFT_774798 [Sparassis latifolia]